MNTLFSLAVLALFDLREARTVVVTETADFCLLETSSSTSSTLAPEAPPSATAVVSSLASVTLTSATSTPSNNPTLSLAVSANNDAVATGLQQSPDVAENGANSADPAAISTDIAVTSVGNIVTSAAFSSNVLTGPTETPNLITSSDVTTTTTITRTITSTITTSIDYSTTARSVSSLPISISLSNAFPTSSSAEISSLVTSAPSIATSSNSVETSSPVILAASVPTSASPIVESASETATIVSSTSPVSSPDTSTVSNPTSSSALEASTVSPATSSAAQTSSPTVSSAAQTSSATVSSAAPQPTLSAFAQDVLDYHNQVRAIHQAPPMVWNQTIADFANQYLNTVIPTCNFAHSGGPYGENIALGYPTTDAALEAWYDEYQYYNYQAGQFSEQTGHFTQMVWVGSTSVGCAEQACSDGREYIVCEYYPRGNVIGWFTQNVLPPS